MVTKGTRSEAADLPDAELDVLGCLWQAGEGTARQVRETIKPYRPMSHGATVTLLTRLQAKGLLTRAKAAQGKAFVYRPTRGPQPTYRRILRDLKHRLFGGNGLSMVASLLEAHPPTTQELDRLQVMLDDLRREQDTTKR